MMGEERGVGRNNDNRKEIPSNSNEMMTSKIGAKENELIGVPRSPVAPQVDYPVNINKQPPTLTSQAPQK
jgi:hypothetical protein